MRSLAQSCAHAVRQIGVTVLEILYRYLFFTPFPKLKLVYFESTDPIREALRDASIAFEDVRVSLEEVETKYSGKQLPVLTVGGDVYSQSKAILRYAGKAARQYPKNPEHALKVDEMLELHTEFVAPLLASTHPQKFGFEPCDTQRNWCVQTHIPKYFDLLESMTAGGFLGDFDSKTIADILWHSTLLWLKEGKFDERINEASFEAYPLLNLYVRPKQSDTVSENVDETETTCSE